MPAVTASEHAAKFPRVAAATMQNCRMQPRSVVALVDATSTVERELVRDWLAAGGVAREFGVAGPVDVVGLDAAQIRNRLTGRRDDPLVVPVTVVWLPPERDGVRRTTVADLVVLGNPRKPNRLAQRWIRGHAPDRHVVLTGAPATLGRLRARNPDDSDAALARAILRAGVVALERAQRSLIGDRYKVPRLVAEEIMDSAEFRGRLSAIAARAELSQAEVFGRAERGLNGLVAAQSRLISDLFTQAMRPVHASTWRVDADAAGLERLRELNRAHPLVFLPSHRSYVDAFVLGDVLAHHDFPPNHLVGGANLRFWPIGPIARRTGTIFIRRSFGDDEVYKALVEEYFAYLLAKRFNLEWYFEGGRTRTGKLRPPRYGLLNYLASAVRNGRVPDVVLVPVSITYERLNELGAIAEEQVGGGKRAEGLAWLARYIRNQRHWAGRVYVRFGEPISAREHQAGQGDSPSAGEDTHRRAVQRLAFDVAVEINRITPITVNALVTLVLLGVNHRALTLAQVRGVIAPVLRYIDRRGLPRGELDALRDDQGLAVVLEQLSVAKVVTVYRGGLEPVYAIDAGQHLVAAFYRNSAVHWFVNRAILELAVLGAGDDIAAGWQEVLRLRDLLKFEFFFPSRTEFLRQMTAELELVAPDWADHPPHRGELMARLADTGFFMAHRSLRSFFDAQLVVAERLAARAPGAAVDRAELIDECVAVGRQMVLQNRLHSTESVSSELFATALKLADHMRLVEPGADDLACRRASFVDELRAIGKRVSMTASLDVSNQEE
jgi:glycerol-3-phosphate O-acyltransferase